MKESDITQPVIDKCKQIAEYWRMEIYEGCWIVLWNGQIKLIDCESKEDLDEDGYSDKDLTPIPSISDCLEKLDELGWVVWVGNADDSEVKSPWVCHIYKIDEYKEENYGDNPLEALLSALLEVLKND